MKRVKSSLALLAVLGGCGSNPYAGESVADGGNDDGPRRLPPPDLAGSSSGPVASQPDAPTAGEYHIPVVPPRMLDLVFMIDNSPSMAPKQAKLSAQFPRLLAALKDPTDGTLPDLRVAIIDSDLGTGGAYTSGSCGPKNGSLYGDQGRFQMPGATACGVTSPDSLFLEYKGGAAVNYVGNIEDVFTCLAGNLGTVGCGEEHSLEAMEFALVAQGIGNEAQQKAFLRPGAVLGLVFLTDEDDCSAAVNDGMFGARPGGTDLSAESASLRCSTRSHQCSGANLSNTGPGYPTTKAFSTPLSQCAARTDACPNPIDSPNVTSPTDTSLPTICSPLRAVASIAAHLKQLKSNPDQIFVAGIFGWPINDSDMALSTYKIDAVPNPASDTAYPTVWDSWPICYDPNHAPTTAGFEVEAAGWGATAGLRNAAFVNQFGANGAKASICAADFAGSMSAIGSSLAQKLMQACISDVLVDADPSTPGVQPDCQVKLSTPSVDSITGQITYVDSDTLPACPPGATNASITTACWLMTASSPSCPASSQLVQLLRPASQIASGPLPVGTQLHLQCKP